MPIFGYTCEKCDHKFDRIVNLSERDEKQHCPQCESQQTYRELFPTKAPSNVVNGACAKNNYGLKPNSSKP